MIDKTLLVARINCQLAEIIYQTQISNELDKGIDAIECFTRDYKSGRVILEEIEDFMSKNKKELLNYRWNEENSYITFLPQTLCKLYDRINLPNIVNSLEYNQPDVSMTEQTLIEELKINAKKILEIRKDITRFRVLIESKTKLLNASICRQKEIKSGWATYQHNRIKNKK